MIIASIFWNLRQSNCLNKDSQVANERTLSLLYIYNRIEIPLTIPETYLVETEN